MASQCCVPSASQCISQISHAPVKWAATAARAPAWTPRCRSCRCPAAGRPAALFGFGKQEPAQAAPTQQQPQADAGPLLIPFTPVQKTADYSLRLYSAYTVAEVEYERRDEGFFQLGS